MKYLLLLALGAALAACAPAAAGQGNRLSDREALEISSHPVAIKGGTLNGLRLRGTVVLTADHGAFGGFSGLKIADGRMLAVSDVGWLLNAPLIDDGDGLRPGAAEFVALRDSDGERFDKKGGDAEGVAGSPDDYALSFERDHRITAATPRGQAEIRHRAFETLRSNSGIEALARLPDGRLLAIAEGHRSGGAPAFLITGETVETGALPLNVEHYVTGADFGPDGRLYVVLRDYSFLSGVSIRIHRYGLAENGFPDQRSREVLAEFESESGIDNMEGIARWRDAKGILRLTLISDNNFNALQRTLVIDFEVLE